MTIPVLAILLIIAIIVFVRIASGVNIPLWIFRWLWDLVKPKRRDAQAEYVENVAALMMQDERVVPAIYARPSRYEREANYLLTFMALLLALFALPVFNSSSAYQRLGLLIFTFFFPAGILALGRMDDRIDLYRDIINRYEEKLKIPKWSLMGKLDTK